MIPVVNNNQCLDKNIFLDSQLSNPKLTWELLYQKSTSSKNSNGSEVKKPVSDWSEVILVGIIKDNNIQINVSNEFDSNLNVGFVNSIKEVAQKGIDMMSLFKGGLNNLDGESSTIPESDKGILDRLSKITRGSQIQVGTDYLKMYRGTSISYTIPEITARIYEGVYYSPENTVITKLMEVIDVLSGHYQGITGLFKDGANLNGVFGAMTAPNNYVPSFDGIGTDYDMTGTFKLRYGDYVYRNLLVSSFDIDLSNFKVLDKDGNPTNRPLYADIKLTLVPANFITSDNIKSFLSQNVY